MSARSHREAACRYCQRYGRACGRHVATSADEAAWPVSYAVTAHIGRTGADGWVRATHLPTFYLHTAVQGIVSAEHAARIALRMLTDVTGPDVDVVTLNVVADDLTQSAHLTHDPTTGLTV